MSRDLPEYTLLKLDDITNNFIKIFFNLYIIDNHICGNSHISEKKRQNEYLFYCTNKYISNSYNNRNEINYS